MSVEKISQEATEMAENVQKIDAESIAQKASQVEKQAESAADQAKAKAADAIQDAKAATDKINKELGKIPQKIEEKLDEAIHTLEKAMGWSPEIKKVKIKKPDGTEIEVPDFDPNKILDDLSKVINPVIGAISPVESVAGKIPVIGDLVSLLTTLGTDKTGESEISKEDVLAMVPKAPDIPASIYKKINRLMQLIQQFIQELPIILIDVIFQMLAAIYDMFDQIVGIIGVPPAIFPFSLIKSVVSLPPKIKTLIQQMPTQADTLVTEKLKQKFQYAMALSVPKPNISVPSVSDVKNVANSTASGSTKSSTNEATKQEVAPPTQSQPPPVESNIPETPSIPEAEPKAPIAPDTKPEIKTWRFRPKGIYSPTGQYYGKVIDIESTAFSDDELKQIEACPDKPHYHNFSTGIFSKTWYQWYCDCPLGKRATEMASNDSDWKEVTEEEKRRR